MYGCALCVLLPPNHHPPPHGIPASTPQGGRGAFYHSPVIPLQFFCNSIRLPHFNTTSTTPQGGKGYHRGGGGAVSAQQYTYMYINMCMPIYIYTHIYIMIRLLRTPKRGALCVLWNLHIPAFRACRLALIGLDRRRFSF